MYIELQLSDHETRPFEPIAHSRLVDGELYLFRTTDDPLDEAASLWGVFYRRDDEEIILESSSRDLVEFAVWHRLPDGFRYCRLAARDELRDYTAALTFHDCARGALR